MLNITLYEVIPKINVMFNRKHIFTKSQLFVYKNDSFFPRSGRR